MNARLLFILCIVVYVEQVTCSVLSVIAAISISYNELSILI